MTITYEVDYRRTDGSRGTQHLIRNKRAAYRYSRDIIKSGLVMIAQIKKNGQIIKTIKSKEAK